MHLVMVLIGRFVIQLHQWIQLHFVSFERVLRCLLVFYRLRNKSMVKEQDYLVFYRLKLNLSNLSKMRANWFAKLGLSRDLFE